MAATLLTAAYYIVRDGVDYRDLGADHFVRRERDQMAMRLARRNQELGYDVTLHKAA